MSSSGSKHELRAFMRGELARHGIEERAAASKRACEHALLASQYTSAKTLLLYMAMSVEADPAQIAYAALAANKRVVYPRCVEGNRLELYEGDTIGFTANKYGILEPDPSSASRVSPTELDMIIVPGVAFDKDRMRLGHGAGYYDRLFNEVQPHTFKLGFAFSWQLVEAVPSQAHDVRMDAVVTENGIL